MASLDPRWFFPHPDASRVRTTWRALASAVDERNARLGSLVNLDVVLHRRLGLRNEDVGAGQHGFVSGPRGTAHHLASVRASVLHVQGCHEQRSAGSRPPARRRPPAAQVRRARAPESALLHMLAATTPCAPLGCKNLAMAFCHGPRVVLSAAWIYPGLVGYPHGVLVQVCVSKLSPRARTAHAVGAQGQR